MEDRKLRVCWLKDNKPGHLTKIRGLIKALSAVREVSVFECPVKWRPKYMRGVLALVPFLRNIYPLHYCLNLPPSSEAFDLIVSAGGATEWPNARLSKLCRAKNIYLGSLRLCDTREFSLLPRIDEDDGMSVMQMSIVPSELNRSKAAVEASRAFPEDMGKTWTVLIGGNGSGVSWTENDWFQLANGVIQAARQSDVQLIVTTSRRTGRRGEEILKSAFQASGILARAAWFSEGGLSNAPSLVAMIGQSELVWVTEDSASMVNEAVASGRPVITLRPGQSRPDSLIEGMLCRFEGASYIHRNKKLDNIKLPEASKEWILMQDDWHHAFGKQILNRLDMKKEGECF